MTAAKTKVNGVEEGIMGKPDTMVARSGGLASKVKNSISGAVRNAFRENGGQASALAG